MTRRRNEWADDPVVEEVRAIRADLWSEGGGTVAGLLRVIEHPRPARVVMLRYFGGLTEEQIARTLDVSRRTVQGDWKFARVWLLDRMQRHGETEAAEIADHDD